MNQELSRIALTNKEIIIFKYIKEYSLTLSDVIPRVVGGWVRDKLLNKQSIDIDICVSNITGREFALGFQNWLHRTKNLKVQTKIIEANTDKSKHLESIILIINGLHIDFLNLREEKYSDSRIPIIKFADVENDAKRRDLTINAIYYNLITENVEDFIGGLIDLKKKILKTPLNPITTFMDDPLRILRIVRFHCVLNFKIDSEILSSFLNLEVRASLSKKVSNERIGKEIKITFKTEKFGDAAMIYDSANLIDIILKPQLELCVIADIPKFYYFVKKEQTIQTANAPKKSAVQIEIPIKETRGNFIKTLHSLYNSPFSVLFSYNKLTLNLYSLLFQFIGYKKGKTCLNAFIIKNSLKYCKVFAKTISCIERNISLLSNNFNLFKEYKKDICKIKCINLLRLIRLMGQSYKETFLLFLCLTTNGSKSVENTKNYEILYEICRFIEGFNEKLFDNKEVREVTEVVNDLNLKGEEFGRAVDVGKLYWNCIGQNKEELKELLKSTFFYYYF